MSQPQKRRFGPLLIVTLVVGGLASLYSGIEVSSPWIQRWLADIQVGWELKDPDTRVRLAALSRVAHESSSVAQPHLLQALRDPSVEVRVASGLQLVGRWLDLDAVMPVLESAATDSNEQVRYEIARNLGSMAIRFGPMAVSLSVQSNRPKIGMTQRCRETLLRLLKDSSRLVRAAAAKSLGDMEANEGARLALVESSNDSDPEVQLAIARALLKHGGLADPVASEILCRLVADPEPGADRVGVLTVVGMADEACQLRVIQTLADLLDHGDPIILPEVIQSLIQGFFHNELLIPALDRLLDHADPLVRAAAATATATIEGKVNPRVLRVLIQGIGDTQVPLDVRTDALARVQEAAPARLVEATPPLLRQLTDSNVDVRRAAISILAQIIEDQPARLPVGDAKP